MKPFVFYSDINDRGEEGSKRFSLWDEVSESLLILSSAEIKCENLLSDHQMGIGLIV